MKKEFICYLLIIIIIVLAIIGIGFIVYVYVRYANTPLKDLPAWVIPFFTN